MTATTGEIVGEIYAAWRARDLRRTALHLSEDFSHIIKVPLIIHPLGGARHGKQAALDRMQAIIAQFDFAAYTPDELIVTGERAATQVDLTYVHRESGEPLETTTAHFWTLRQGRVVELVEYHDPVKLQNFADKVIALI